MNRLPNRVVLTSWSRTSHRYRTFGWSGDPYAAVAMKHQLLPAGGGGGAEETTVECHPAAFARKAASPAPTSRSIFGYWVVASGWNRPSQSWPHSNVKETIGSRAVALTPGPGVPPICRLKAKSSEPPGSKSTRLLPNRNGDWTAV